MQMPRNSAQRPSFTRFGPMIDFLRDLFSRPGATRTVVLLEPETMSTPRQYEVRPGLAVYAGIIAAVALGAVLVAALVLTPLRGLLGGADTGELRAVAQANAARAEALEDSVLFQYQQIEQLRALITGEADALGSTPLDASALTLPDLDTVAAASAPAPVPQTDVPDTAPRALGPVGAAPSGAAARYLAGLRLPALPPLDGVLSRGFDVASGHFAIDIAAAEGTPVRSVGDGYVVLADWTHDGGHTIAVQHAGGFLSSYKHNARLLKRVGERVRARETLALSGDTGEITSGPHLHFELWRDGLAQDPASVLLLP